MLRAYRPPHVPRLRRRAVGAAVARGAPHARECGHRVASAYLAALALGAGAAAVFVVLGVRSRSSGGAAGGASRAASCSCSPSSPPPPACCRCARSPRRTRRSARSSRVAASRSPSRRRASGSGRPGRRRLRRWCSSRVPASTPGVRGGPAADRGGRVSRRHREAALGVGLLGARRGDRRGAARRARRAGGRRRRPLARRHGAAIVVQRMSAPRTGCCCGLLPGERRVRRALDLVVTSISGSRDGLATPADIADSRSDFPAEQLHFVVVPGAVHADFGDYGTQRGDGERAISHAAAQRELSRQSCASCGRSSPTGPIDPSRTTSRCGERDSYSVGRAHD